MLNQSSVSLLTVVIWPDLIQLLRLVLDRILVSFLFQSINLQGDSFRFQVGGPGEHRICFVSRDIFDLCSIQFQLKKATGGLVPEIVKIMGKRGLEGWEGDRTTYFLCRFNPKFNAVSTSRRAASRVSPHTEHPSSSSAIAMNP